jgi:hypothetical protein
MGWMYPRGLDVCNRRSIDMMAAGLGRSWTVMGQVVARFCMTAVRDISLSVARLGLELDDRAIIHGGHIMRRFRMPAGMLLLLACLAHAAETCAAPPQGSIPPELIIQRFAVGRGGDFLLIPVKLGGKDRLFVVDTGASSTVVDISLLIEKPREVVTVGTAVGVAKVGLFDPPDASIGGLPLRIDTVYGMDMNALREVSGLPVEGILGMDFLGQHVIHVNFDRGELLLLKSVPQDPGQKFPITWKRGDMPEIEASVVGEKKIRFAIDTGAVGLDSGALEARQTRSLFGRSEFRKVGSALEETASGTSSSPLYQGKRLVLGDFQVERPVFSGAHRLALLGLGFWSRFEVTVDFPARKLYLKKGQSYERPDRWNTSGLHIIRRNGSVVVHSVDGGSPGAIAGVRSGDKLLALDDLLTDDKSLYELGAALCGDGRRVCLVERGDRAFRRVVNLPVRR